MKGKYVGYVHYASLYLHCGTNKRQRRKEVNYAKTRIYKYLAWLLVFIFTCSFIFVSNGNTDATSKKNIKSIMVKTGGKTVTEKTITLQKEKKTALKIYVSPHKGKESVTYTSSRMKKVRS